MNKKTVSKVNLFFGGLVSRMEENKDFFNDITINLKSGTKNFPAKILYTDDITLDYQAVKRKVEKDGLWDIIVDAFTSQLAAPSQEQISSLELQYLLSVR